MQTDQTIEKLLKEDMIPTDRKREILLINSTCDLTKVIKTFRNYLERQRHGAVMEEEPDSFPHRPKMSIIDGMYQIGEINLLDGIRKQSTTLSVKTIIGRAASTSQ